MPYIVASKTEISVASASFSMAIPTPHAAGDLLLALISQDGGGTAIAATGWTDVEASQAAAQGQRTTALYKFATGSTEAAFAATGSNDEWVVCIVVIRGANATTPIHANNRADSANSTTAFLDSGTVTTTENNCLLIYASGWDGDSRNVMPANHSELTYISKALSAANIQIVGYRNQVSAGITPAIRVIHERATEGGQILLIAISDATPATPSMSPDSRASYNILRHYGGAPDSAAGVSAFSRHDPATVWQNLSNITPTTLDGLDISTEFDGVITEVTTEFWGSATKINSSNAELDAGKWRGATHAITSTNLKNKIFSVEFAAQGLFQVGDKGYALLFQDASGNWAAFSMRLKKDVVQGAVYGYMVEPEFASKIGSAGTIDWEAVTKIAYLWHRFGANTSAGGPGIRNAILIDKVVLTGGCNGSPINYSFLDRVMGGWHIKNTKSNLQGKEQTLSRYSVQVGDGTSPACVKTSASSYELPVDGTPAWDANINSLAAEFSIKASASDNIDKSACVMATDSSQLWKIDPASSPDATYNFNGLTLVGWVVSNNSSGIRMNGVVFSACRGITLNGGRLLGCTIDGSLTSPALTTNNPANIEDCDFISSGTGHAIEITVPGSYNFVGNTFTGYGANDTGNAAIYNDSGGAVVLQVASGGQVPTVLNGAGSSTSFAIPPYSITLRGIVDGSAYYIKNLATSAVIAEGFHTTGNLVVPNVVYDGSPNIVFVRIRNSSVTPFYKQFTTEYIEDGNNQSVFVRQERDD